MADSRGMEGRGQRERDRDRDRDRDRQTERLTDRQTDRQTETERDREREDDERERDRQIDRQTDRQRRQRETERATDRQPNRQTEREREADTERHRPANTQTAARPPIPPLSRQTPCHGTQRWPGGPERVNDVNSRQVFDKTKHLSCLISSHVLLSSSL